VTRPAVWRILILLATLFCVAMLFTPLVREMLQQLLPGGGGGVP
jgi:hypothetical protein